MELLAAKHGPDKLAILAFPSKEYANEEFDTNEEIRAFAASRNFPFGRGGYLMALGSVRGDSAPSLWKYLRDATGSSDPAWNFDSVYLVSKTGAVSLPTNNVEADIEALLAE